MTGTNGGEAEDSQPEGRTTEVTPDTPRAEPFDKKMGCLGAPPSAIRGTGNREYDGKTDEELVAQYYSGDEKAFTILYSRYRDRQIRLARRLFGNETDAEDAFQTAWVKFYETRYGRAKFDLTRKFQPWISTILRNTVLNIARRGSVNYIGSFEDAFETPTAPTVSTELHEAIQECMAQLTDRERNVVERKDFEGQTYEEIKAETGVALTTLFEIRKTALEKLRSCIGALGHDLESE